MLTGDWRANVIEGGKGNDRLDGCGGADRLVYANAEQALDIFVLADDTPSGIDIL